MVISVIVNIILMIALYYVSFIETDFAMRVGNRLGICQYTAPRADADCVLSWNNCIEQLNTNVDVVFFGDSHIAGGRFAETFPKYKVINLGYIGEDPKGMLRRVPQIEAVHPTKVFVMAGINGLKAHTLEHFERDYAMLVDSILQSVPCELYLQSILPVTSNSDYCPNEKIRQANQLIQTIANERDLVYVDLYEEYANEEGDLPTRLSLDGLHLTKEAYTMWYKRLNTILSK